uniref:Uncharacterized protein n=1 Tax=Zosterops lateralis melanops TaxID=1220523 RepID=A0A8D2QMJ9_ZOSLA
LQSCALLACSGAGEGHRGCPADGHTAGIHTDPVPKQGTTAVPVRAHTASHHLITTSLDSGLKSADLSQQLSSHLNPEVTRISLKNPYKGF